MPFDAESDIMNTIHHPGIADSKDPESLLSGSLLSAIPRRSRREAPLTADNEGREATRVRVMIVKRVL